MPAVRVSMLAIVLQMACEKEFREPRQARPHCHHDGAPRCHHRHAHGATGCDGELLCGAIPVSPTEASEHPSADDVGRHSGRASGIQCSRDDDQVAHGASKALCGVTGSVKEATAMVNKDKTWTAE